MDKTFEKRMNQDRENGTQSSFGAERRFCRAGWCGVMMIIAGMLLLFSKLNWINPDFFWPLFLIAVGFFIILPVLSRHDKESDRQTADGSRNSG